MGIRRDHLRRGVGLISDFPKRGHHLRPIHISLQQIHESVQGAHVSPKILEMNPFDPLAQNLDPVLRIARGDHVAHVEVHAHVVAVHRIHEIPHLQRTQQEFIPHVFHTHGHLELLRHRRQLPDGRQGPLVRHVVRDDLASRHEIHSHRSGHHEDRVHAQPTGDLQFLFGDVQRLLPHVRIVARQRVRPEQPGSEAGQFDPDPVRGLPYGPDLRLRRIQGDVSILRQGQLNGLETRILGQFHTSSRRILGERPLVDALFDHAALLSAVKYPPKRRKDRRGRRTVECLRVRCGEPSLYIHKRYSISSPLSSEN